MHELNIHPKLLTHAIKIDSSPFPEDLRPQCFILSKKVSEMTLWQNLFNDMCIQRYKVTQAPKTNVRTCIYFFISQPKHMLWVLKRTVSMRPFF